MAVRFSSGRAERSILTKIANRPEISNPNGNFRCVFRKKRERDGAVPFGTANSEFKIQDSKLLLGVQPAERTHEADLWDASCGPPPGGGCGPLRPFRTRMKKEELKVKNDLRAAACGGRTRLQGIAGLRRPQAAARTVLTDRFPPKSSPQPSGRACTSGPAGREMQPSARGRLRAAAPFGRNSASKIQDSKSPIGLQPAERTHEANLRDARSGPSRGEAPARCAHSGAIHPSKLAAIRRSLRGRPFPAKKRPPRKGAASRINADRGLFVDRAVGLAGAVVGTFGIHAVGGPG